MEYLTVGTIIKTVGLKGEVKIYPSTHFRDSRFSKGSHVFLRNQNGEILEELTITKHRHVDQFDFVVFQNFDSIEKVEPFVKLDLVVEKDNTFLNKNEYFFCDLEKLDVYFDNGTYIGKVKKVEEFTSYATLRVEHKPKDVLIPFVKAFIKSVDLEEKKIVINFIEGLL